MIEIVPMAIELPYVNIMISSAAPNGSATKPQRPSGLRVFHQLVSSQIASGEGLKAWRFINRAVRSPVSTLSWLRALDRLRLTTGTASAPFYLARKPGRDFLHHQLSYRQKITLLSAHYHHLVLTMGPRFTGKLLEGQSFILAEFHGKSGGAYRLSMERNDLFCREGEIIVELRRADDDLRIATLSLVIGAVTPGAAADLWVGGLQGCKGEDSKAVTVATTKELWGLRPKDLMMNTAFCLHHLFALNGLKVIGNAGHIDHRPRAKVLKRRADYDGFWLELGGAPIGGDFFALPPERRRRCEDEVPAAKRKAWRLRQALAADIDAQIRHLDAHGDGGASPINRSERGGARADGPPAGAPAPAQRP